MFPPRFFPTRYFAGRYWPVGGGAAAGTGPPYSVQMVQAYTPGAENVDAFTPGAQKGDSFVPGAHAIEAK